MYIPYNNLIRLSHGHACADAEGEGLGSHLPGKITKLVGFLSNTVPDPLKNNKATKPAFNVEPSSARQRNAIKLRFAGGPIMARLKWYLDPLSHQQKNPSNLDPL